MVGRSTSRTRLPVHVSACPPFHHASGDSTGRLSSVLCNTSGGCTALRAGRRTPGFADNQPLGAVVQQSRRRAGASPPGGARAGSCRSGPGSRRLPRRPVGRGAGSGAGRARDRPGRDGLEPPAARRRAKVPTADHQRGNGRAKRKRGREPGKPCGHGVPRHSPAAYLDLVGQGLTHAGFTIRTGR
jgi:hypothetical protein